MLRQGDVISYLELCQEEGVNLQRGMNFRLRGKKSVILMSLRPGAPYADHIENNGQVLIYEGHDTPSVRGGPDPKTIDQPHATPGGIPTQNGLFYAAAMNYQRGRSPAELVKVYEKIKAGIWVYNGLFQLEDAWRELSGPRQVFKFKLKLVDDVEALPDDRPDNLEHTRLIPSSVKLEVWKRDKGQCVICGSHDNLHFDHVIPYAKGGSSLVAANIQLMCARHNLAKSDKIL